MAQLAPHHPVGASLLAKAVCQLASKDLEYRFREQARSHMDHRSHQKASMKRYTSIILATVYQFFDTSPICGHNFFAPMGHITEVADGILACTEVFSLIRR
jgi:hypothetical protein